MLNEKTDNNLIGKALKGTMDFIFVHLFIIKMLNYEIRRILEKLNKIRELTLSNRIVKVTFILNKLCNYVFNIFNLIS